MLGYSENSRPIRKLCKNAKVLKRAEAAHLGLPFTMPNRGLLIINEADLYRLVTNSQLPEVEPWKSWLYEEVISSIVRTGKYDPKPQLPTGEPTLDSVFAYLEDPRRTLRLIQSYRPHFYSAQYIVYTSMVWKTLVFDRGPDLMYSIYLYSTDIQTPNLINELI